MGVMESSEKYDLWNGRLDSEFQYYRMLAEIQFVQEQLVQRKLFPWLPQHEYKRKQLLSILKVMKRLSRFENVLIGMDWDEKKLKYVPKNQLKTGDIDQIISFSLSGYEWTVSHGMQVLHELEEKIHLMPLGINMMYQWEGYLLVRPHESDDAALYRYSWHGVSSPLSTEGTIHTTLTTWMDAHLKSNSAKLRNQISKLKEDLPAPALYFVEVDEALPMENTVIPLVCRQLQKILEKG